MGNCSLEIKRLLRGIDSKITFIVNNNIFLLFYPGFRVCYILCFQKHINYIANM